MKKYALIIILLFFSACSRLDVVLSFVPRYVTNELDDAFDLNSERYRKIKKVIADDIDTNKKEFFSSVIVKIDDLLVLTDKKEFNESEAQQVFNEIKVLQKKVVHIFKPSFSETILQLSADEVGYLNNYSQKKFKETDERLADKENYYKYYTKMYIRYMNLLFDSSNDEQDRRIKSFLEANYDYYKYQSQIRKNFLKQFEILFDKKTELLDFTLKYYAGDEDIKSEAYSKKQSDYYDNIVTLGYDLWKSSSDKQKKNFRKNVSAIKDELKNLIK